MTRKHQQVRLLSSSQPLSLLQKGHFIVIPIYVSIAQKKSPPKRGFYHPSHFRIPAYQPVISFSAAPMSARERTVLTPASCSAANFSSAVPLPPEMIAPA
jgi:hypothetical protein